MPAVYVKQSGTIAHVTLDRPPLNVLDIATLEDLSSMLKRLRSDTGLRAIVLNGAGRGFSAGVDVADHTPERVPAMLEAVTTTIHTLFSFPAPTIALVHGHVLGGGLELALACDMIVAYPDAVLGLPEIKLGVFAPYAAVLLPSLVGRQAALHLLYTGETIDAQAAYQLGLVQAVLADNETQQLDSLLQTLTGHSASALRLTKQAVLQTLGQPLEQALSSVNQLYAEQLMHTPDAHEGLAAFIEKRSPQWEL